MYEVRPSSRFKRDVRTLAKRGYDMRLIEKVVKDLSDGKTLAPKHRDHAMQGSWVGHRNCHITPDWVLLYKKDEEKDVLILVLTRTGTHSDLSI
jgi:mRNA interferase YafQ